MIKIKEEIIAKAKRLQNGDVSRAMKKMGIIYTLNYGVSIPQLRQLANQYSSNTNLALLLINTDIREANLVGSMLFENDTLSIEQLMEISQKVTHLELVEQYSQNIYAHSTKLPELLPLLIKGTEWQQLLAIYAAAWQIKKYKSVHPNTIIWAKKQLTLVETSDNNLLHKAIGFLFQTLASISDDFKQEMFSLVDELFKSDRNSVQNFAQEFLWLNMA